MSPKPSTNQSRRLPSPSSLTAKCSTADYEGHQPHTTRQYVLDIIHEQTID